MRVLSPIVVLLLLLNLAVGQERLQSFRWMICGS
jgi:hypothetical protein